MIDKVCLKLKDSTDSYICNEAWFKGSDKLVGKYTVIKNIIISCMEDLIKYCMVYNYEIDISETYKLVTIYNIVFSTGNFEPEDRTCSSCSSSIIFSSTDLNYIQKKFKIMCKQVHKKARLQGDSYFCWHTEDYAVNQIIHSYKIDKSYIVEKLEVD